MNSLSDRLNCRVDLFHGKPIKNEFNELDYRATKVKSLWTEITPQSGNQIKGQANTVFAEISHKFVVRSNAINEIKLDMYFVYKKQKYKIKYYNPNYKYSDCLEIFCSLVLED